MEDIKNYIDEIKDDALLERLSVTANMIRQSTKGLSRVSEGLSEIILNNLSKLSYTTREEVQALSKKNVYYYENFVVAINRYLDDIDKIYELLDNLEKLIDKK